MRLAEHRRRSGSTSARRPAGSSAARPPGAARARAAAARSRASRTAPRPPDLLTDCTGAVARRSRAALLELLEAVRDRLALEVRGRPRDLDERELERQARIAALAHVVDGDREQVAEPDDRRLAELVRLRPQALARLVGQRQRVGHLAHVLDEQQVAQVLEQIGDEAAEILALLGELLEERQRTGRVAVDDEVADPEERLLLDRAEQLEHRLHGDLALGRGGRAGRASRPRRGSCRAPSGRSARAPPRAPRSPRRRRPSSGSGRAPAAAAARARTSGSATGRSPASSAARSCRRRRRGGAEAPRSASAAR